MMNQVPDHLLVAIDHVGIAVPDLDDALEFYASTFGLHSVHEEVNEEQGVREAMLAVGDSGSCIQLLAPLSDDSTIAKFLDRNGQGIQQLAYRVSDIDAVSATLRERGVRLLYDAPKRGTSESRVNFVHPKDAGGVLVELVEPAEVASSRTQEDDVKNILDAIQAGDTPGEEFAAIEIPETYQGITVHKDEVDMFADMPTKEKDPRKSLHLDDVPVPELAPGEALVAVMASAINYNTVWTSIFEPLPTFAFLERYGRLSEYSKRHDLPYHVVGSDLAGVVLRTGPGVTVWKPGQEVVAHCLSVELESPDGHDDTMMDPQQRIWGFETNFGGLAELAIVKANQLMPKPDHLTWEEAASPGLVNSTAYRQLVSHNGAQHEAGRRRADLGRLRRPRLLRHPDGAQRRRHPGVRRLLAREGRDRALARRRARHRPLRRGLHSSGRTRTPRTPRSGSASARRSASSPAARTPTSSSSTPAARRSAPRSTSRARAARSSPAPRPRATCTSTTTAISG